MLKCNQVSKLVSTDEVQELNFMKKVEFKMHLLMCVHCQRYVQQIKSLGQGVRNLAGTCEVEPEQIHRMEKQVLEDVKGQ